MNQKEEIVKKMGEWILRVLEEYDKATPEMLQVLPEIAKFFIRYY